MRKGSLILIAISVCALLQVRATAQAADSSTGTAVVSEASATTAAPHAVMNVSELQAKLNESREALKSSANLVNNNTVVLSALDRDTEKIEILSVAKDSFLTKGAQLPVKSQTGRSLQLTIVRANGVNTAVRVIDPASGKELTPLTVAFPIVKGGSLTEIAYYNSAHPALVTSDVAAAGETYISAMLDKAAHDLDAKGIHVPADIVDVAEHLCVVEHTDHRRFMTEDHATLLPEIVSLYALNAGNTFRYSVSTAGAGGMIQMIPRTYGGVRQQHSSVPLQADFVDGMRDHGNALQAMLLYMNDTWTTLAESSDVQAALRDGIASKPELLAAGYNSNPGRLPTYLKNGGSNWRTLIPAETQMYLAIYSEVDRNINFAGHEDLQGPLAAKTNPVPQAARIESLMAWMNNFFARIL
ncbi:MAG TPA: hypothetical protein VE961_06420 [Pyrinomonadaceae bacterium]|nr:hypothetical protein [Pyrinomonadaceae bacterium]